MISLSTDGVQKQRENLSVYICKNESPYNAARKYCCLPTKHVLANRQCFRNALVLYMHSKKKKDAQILIVYGANREVWVFCNTVLWSKEYEQNLFTDKTASGIRITGKDAKSSSIAMVLHL